MPISSLCCLSVLKSATQGKSVAVPLLSSGIYAIPHEISASALVKATAEFLRENAGSSLQEVHFVDNDDKAIDALMKEMIKAFQHDDNFKVDRAVKDQWIPYLKSLPSTPDTTNEASSYSGNVFHTPQGMEIRMTVGNIAESRVSLQDFMHFRGMQKKSKNFPVFICFTINA